ncbi:MAG: cation-transporting P-type ATPase [Candidatus Levybacteria bacterium]|nr:cation-transporting P-type ATPase [Candidatus Levybacteria bacterium]MBP9815147.1 cation-transporting P-type ATPase [Candidatus Levybacteria bacterium]
MPTDNIQGLSASQIPALQKQFGENSVETNDSFFFLKLLLSQYKDITTLILFLAGVFSYFIGDTIDMVFIFMVLVFNGIFGFIQEYRAHDTIGKLKELVSPIARVIRDGQETEIDARYIVPSDIVVIREGDKIPADGKLITNVSMEVDESILTGESIPVEKSFESLLFSGTFVVRGRGMFLVEKIGFKTKLGEIASELEKTKKPEIPLAKNLSTLSRRLAAVALILSFALIPIGFLQGRDLTQTILISVSVAVALIPEGLALIVTVGLAFGAYRMVKRKTIMRKMAAVETLGTTNVILSDKTGTLTQNKMKVKKFYIHNKEKENLFLRCMVLGNTANLVLKEDGNSFEITGDGTDGALLAFASEQSQDIEHLQKEGKIIEEKPFNPETKTIEVTWENNNEQHILLRGAPETILALTGEHADVKEILTEYETEGLRAIAFAEKAPKNTHFTLLGITALYDAPRKEAEQAIKEARDAGIKIVMVTGDNPVTAKAIAEEIGLITEGELIVTHDELDKMGDQEVLKLLPQVKIFARMIPTDKLRLVRLYKHAGLIVAVTGDGVNDALALSEAHIGIAMGKTGTDVAKEEADMIITDDNLYTVIKAVEEGRGIYENIVRVVMFLFATNLTEFALILFAVVFALPLPLTPTQILWVNLIGDGLPAFALAIDSKRGNLLKKRPRPASEQILNSKRLKFTLAITGIFSMILIVLFMLALQYNFYPDSLVFNLLVIGEMIIVFIIRGGVFPINRFLIVSVLITLLLQYFAATHFSGFFH